ncbi:hypothetical protein H9P43_008502 [Blastocladiella emersonii ATCC 22665]|nr:hypothetical protein H9P43_008502 [Blastocladiella emersonii ATCC 22665]
MPSTGASTTSPNPAAGIDSATSCTPDSNLALSRLLASLGKPSPWATSTPTSTTASLATSTAVPPVTAPPIPSSAETSSSSSSSLGMILGIVGGVIFLAVLAIATLFIARRRRFRARQQAVKRASSARSPTPTATPNLAPAAVAAAASAPTPAPTKPALPARASVAAVHPGLTTTPILALLSRSAATPGSVPTAPTAASLLTPIAAGDLMAEDSLQALADAWESAFYRLESAASATLPRSGQQAAEDIAARRAARVDRVSVLAAGVWKRIKHGDEFKRSSSEDLSPVDEAVVSEVVASVRAVLERVGARYPSMAVAMARKGAAVDETVMRVYSHAGGEAASSVGASVRRCVFPGWNDAATGRVVIKPRIIAA